MVNPDNHQQDKSFIKKLTQLRPYLVLVCLAALAFSYIQLSKTNVPATQAQIAQLKAAAKVDERPEVAEKLDNELNVTPHPKVWQLNNMKEKLGLTYIDAISPKEETE